MAVAEEGSRSPGVSDTTLTLLYDPAGSRLMLKKKDYLSLIFSMREIEEELLHIV